MTRFLRYARLAALLLILADFVDPNWGMFQGQGQARAAGVPPNVYINTPVNPTGPASTTLTMMGLGVTGSFTPRGSGIAQIIISGFASNNTAADGVTEQINWGTGAAPANAATFTGNTCGVALKEINSSLASSVSTGIPFTVQCLATGLALGTPIWIDLAAAQVTGGTTTLSNITITATEE